MTPGAKLWSEVKLSLSFCWNDISGIEEKRRLVRRGRARERETEKSTTTFPAHILFITRERGSRSLNYWLPSQANIPACQAWFLLSFVPTPSDGACFVLTRTRRCCENCDTWSCVQETGNTPGEARCLPTRSLARPRTPNGGGSGVPGKDNLEGVW